MLPIALAATYLAINLAIVVWIAREETNGRVPPPRVVRTGRVVRYLPPVLGVLYLITIANDWPFVLFVLAFFAGAFWLLDGLLNYPPKG